MDQGDTWLPAALWTLAAVAAAWVALALGRAIRLATALRAIPSPPPPSKLLGAAKRGTPVLGGARGL
jgi:hypothetical protein